MEFAEKTVVITGAAGNLGSAVAQAFAEEGARLVLVGHSTRSLQDRFGDAGEQRLFVAADLREPSAANDVADAAIARFGGVDVLCNIAGAFRMGAPVHETSDETWNFLFDVNARSLFNMVRAVVPRMLARGGGKVVNVGAFAAQKGVAGMGAYCAAKSAVIRLTEAMAAELREHAINVNCVLPTIIDTPENRAAMPDANAARWVAPDDLARVVVFLASPSACAIHGAAIPVTGLA